MRKMKAAVITEPQGPIHVVERDVPQAVRPGAGEGPAFSLCHSDAPQQGGTVARAAVSKGCPATKSPASSTHWARASKGPRPAPATRRSSRRARPKP